MTTYETDNELVSKRLSFINLGLQSQVGYLMIWAVSIGALD